MMPGLGETLSLGCAIAWAIGVIIYKRLGEQLPPLKLCLLKNLIVLGFIIGTVAALRSPFAEALGLERLHYPDLPVRALLIIVTSGIIGIAVADTLYLRALNLIGAGRMGVVGNLFSPFVVALSFVFLGERLTPLQIGGFVLVMLGIVLVNRTDHDDRVDTAAQRKGFLLGALSVALMAVAIVMIKRVLETESFWWIVLLRVAGAVLGLLTLAAAWPSMRRMLRAPGQPTRWGVLIVAAFIGQYLSMTLWLAGYKYTDASVASVLNESASIFIVIFAVIFLKEAIDRRRVVGILITFAGVACMIP
jgi:drug/metabolite transporter (DMT)-like permease